MKKSLLLFTLCLLLIFTGCENRLPDKSEKANSTEDTPASDTNETPESSETITPPESEQLDSEAESKAISTAVELLDRAKVCNDIYTGSLPMDTDTPPQNLGEDNFYLLKSDFSSKEQLEDFWQNTFTGEKSDRFLASFTVEDNNFYTSINGQLHVKEHDTIAPMTELVWHTDNISVKNYTDDKIILEANTSNQASSDTIKSLEIVKVNDNWLLNDSYF